MCQEIVGDPSVVMTSSILSVTMMLMKLHSVAVVAVIEGSISVHWEYTDFVLE